MFGTIESTHYKITDKINLTKKLIDQLADIAKAILIVKIRKDKRHTNKR